MPVFGKTSLERLRTCDHRLQEIAFEVVKRFDCTVVEGHRSEELQNHCFDTGKSKLRWPNSKHNSIPSRAIDIAVWDGSQRRIVWGDQSQYDRETALLFAAFFKGVAAGLGYEVIWGGDWDSDWSRKDQSFHDWPHFELIGKE